MSGEESLRVLVTGAAGQIAYSLLYSIANGDVFGKNQKIDLLLLDIAPMVEAVNGVVMELADCSLDLLTSVVGTCKVEEAFKDIDVAILVGAMPRREGMERKDLLKANANIFKTQGQALDQYAKKSVKVLVVGNPANTNCLIAKTYAKSIPAKNFSCMTRLDQNRATAQIANRLKVSPKDVKKVIIWGNHSSTQYPDVSHGQVLKDGKVVAIKDAVNDDNYLQEDFIKSVQTRGGAIIKARKLSSALSAAKAICDHMRTWWFGTEDDEYASMGVLSDGNSYGIQDGLIFSFPVTIKNKEWSFVEGLNISDFSKGKIDETAKELAEERDAASTAVGA